MRIPLYTLIGTVCALALTACGKLPERVEISDTAERSEHTTVPRVNATSEERFAIAMPRTAPPMGMPGAQAGVMESPFDYDTPETWVEVEPTQFRNPNFLAGPKGEIECYVSVLPGAGAGLLVNANRWRGQMGQDAYTDVEFNALPRAEILGREAIVVDFPGEFSGMGGAAPQQGFRLIGVLTETSAGGVFIKMTGPDELVTAERDNFARFAQSITLKGQPRTQTAAAPPVEIPEAGALPPDHPEIAEPQAIASAPISSSGTQGFTWQTPLGWTELENASPMRLVTLSLGEGLPGECYVVILGGDGGGRLNNMNRWLSQMGEPPLDETELELQPKISLFGEMVPMLVSKGTYTGMGGQALAGTMMLGATAELAGQSVFIKLIAPESVGNANWQNFTDFCASLEQN